jgi:hypothetical protein
MTASQIRAELVEDACANRATPLPRFVTAIAQLSVLTRKDPESLFVDIQNEVQEKTGREMPLW